MKINKDKIRRNFERQIRKIRRFGRKIKINFKKMIKK